MANGISSITNDSSNHINDISNDEEYLTVGIIGPTYVGKTTLFHKIIECLGTNIITKTDKHSSTHFTIYSSTNTIHLNLIDFMWPSNLHTTYNNNNNNNNNQSLISWNYNSYLLNYLSVYSHELSKQHHEQQEQEHSNLTIRRRRRIRKKKWNENRTIINSVSTSRNSERSEPNDFSLHVQLIHSIYQCNIICLIYDLNDPKSFRHLSDIYYDLKELELNAKILIIGNKLDKLYERSLTNSRQKSDKSVENPRDRLTSNRINLFTKLSKLISGVFPSPYFRRLTNRSRNTVNLDVLLDIDLKNRRNNKKILIPKVCRSINYKSKWFRETVIRPSPLSKKEKKNDGEPKNRFTNMLSMRSKNSKSSKFKLPILNKNNYSVYCGRVAVTMNDFNFRTMLHVKSRVNVEYPQKFEPKTIATFVRATWNIHYIECSALYHINITYLLYELVKLMRQHDEQQEKSKSFHQTLFYRHTQQQHHHHHHHHNQQQQQQE
ncbi:hypothetical protein SNEBB_008403 [Seison nebaliae]|nr:hypothetical protein SNEBB_008403 [Seison nebaliae]